MRGRAKCGLHAGQTLDTFARRCYTAICLEEGGPIRRDRQFQEVLELLRRQIESSFSPGESLPSKRELAAMHGVSSTTIQNALKTLAKERCVQIVPRVGCIRANARGVTSRGLKRKKLTVGLLSRRPVKYWPRNEIYPALLNEAARRGIEVVPVANPNPYRRSAGRHRIELAKAPWNTFDVGLLVEADETIGASDPMLRTRRVLAVDNDATRHGIDSVAFADMHGGALAARHLLELGHMRFAVTDEFNEEGYPGDPAWMARRYGFESAVSEAGGVLLRQWRLPVPRRGRPGWSGGGLGTGAHHHFVKATVAAWASAPPSQRPTAFFSLSDNPLNEGRLLEELERHGLRVPRDLSLIIVTWGGKIFGGTEPEVNGMRLTCIDFDLAALVRRVFDAAVELAGRKPRRGRTRPDAPRLFLAPAALMPGQSTAPPPA